MAIIGSDAPEFYKLVSRQAQHRQNKKRKKIINSFI
jgi:hypothetical protein